MFPPLLSPARTARIRDQCCAGADAQACNTRLCETLSQPNLHPLPTYCLQTYNYLRALEQLPGQLVRAGALDAAYRVLMSPVFMELKVQCGLHWQLVRDFELLLREVCHCGLARGVQIS